jgi:hypothetical protein
MQCKRPVTLPCLILELLSFVYFFHFELCPGHNSKTTQGKLFCVQNLFREHHPVQPTLVFLVTFLKYLLTHFMYYFQYKQTYYYRGYHEHHVKIVDFKPLSPHHCMHDLLDSCHLASKQNVSDPTLVPTLSEHFIWPKNSCGLRVTVPYICT